MSFEPEFLTMFPNEIQVEPCVGRNNKNEAVYGKPFQLPCRVSGKALMLRRPDGEMSTPIFDIWVQLGSAVIGEDDRFTIVGDDPRWNRRGPLILFAVGTYTDEDGMHHAKLQCGWQYHRQGQ